MGTLNQNSQDKREGTENPEMDERKPEVFGKLDQNPHHKAITEVKDVLSSRGSIVARGKNTPVYIVYFTSWVFAFTCVAVGLAVIERSPWDS